MQRILLPLAFALVAVASCLVGGIGTLVWLPAPTPQAVETNNLFALATLNAANATRQASLTPTPASCLEAGRDYVKATDSLLNAFIDEINRRAATGSGAQAWKDYNVALWQGQRRTFEAHTPPPCLSEAHRLIVGGMNDLILGIGAYASGKADNGQLAQGEQMFVQGYTGRQAALGQPPPRANWLPVPKR